METLYEDDFLKVTYSRGPKERTCVFLCFTGIGYSLGGIDVQSEEFKKISSLGDVVFIIDKKRSWGNSIDYSLLTDLLSPILSSKKVYALGNSMGGFIAAVFSYYYTLDVCILFCSQFTIDDRVFKEKRWRKYIESIGEIKYNTICDVINRDTKYYCFHGDHEMERQHWERFPITNNVVNYIVQGCGHDVAKKFSESGELYKIINFCVKEDDGGVSLHIERAGLRYYIL